MPEINLYADQLNIETPEQVDLRFPIAGLGSRFVAILLDTLLQTLAYLLLGVIIYATSAYEPVNKAMERQSDTAAKWLVALFILVNFLMFWGYFALFEAFWNGQTPGKRIMKLRVLKDSGRSITLFEALARNLLRIVDMFPSIYLVGVIAMLCNRENKRLGDLVAGTIVVHERADEQPLLAFSSHTPTSDVHFSRSFTSSVYAPPAAQQRFMPNAQAEWDAAESTLPADAVARLTAADLHVIDTFFSRALDLSVEKRAGLSARVAATMATRMGIPLPEGMAPERMLELIAHRMRSQGRAR